MGTLSDISHNWSADLAQSPIGDLQTASNDQRTQQRILRRLMTCPADPVNNLPPDYIWHPTYGAGLPRFIGSTATPAEIAAVVRGQMLQEASVAQRPPPQVTVQLIPQGLILTLSYTDATTGQPVVLSFDVTQ